MQSCNLCVVGVRPIRGGDDTQGGHARTVLGPHNVLIELISVSVGARYLDVHLVTCGGRCGGQGRRDGHRLTVQDGDGDAVRNIESGLADAVGL